MAIGVVFFCQGCGKRFEVDRSLVGRKARCSGCGLVMVVPELAPIAAPSIDPAPSSRTVPEAVSHSLNASEPIPFSIRLDPEDGNPGLRGVREDSEGGGLRRWSLVAILALSFALLAGWSTTGWPGSLAARVVCLWGGFGSAVLGVVGCFAAAFREGLAPGLLSLLAPYQLYFIFTRWSKTARAFLAGMVGTGAIFAAVALPVPRPVLSTIAPRATPPVVEKKAGPGRSPKEVAAGIRTETEGSEASRLLDEQVRIVGRLTALLRTVRTVSTARAVADEFTSLRARMAEIASRMKQPFSLTPAEQAALEAYTETNLKLSLNAYEAEARRVAAIPGVLAALKEGGSPASSPAPASSGPRPARPAGAPARKPAPIADDRFVTMTITNVPNRDAFTVLKDRLKKLADGPYSYIVARRSTNDAMDVSRLAPVSDPERLAGRIDFGRVVRVEGRQIEVEAGLPEYRPDLPNSADSVTVAVDDLTRPASSRRREGAQALVQSPAVGRLRAEGTRKLLPLLVDEEPETRAAAAKALAIWGTSEAVPALIARLGDQEPLVRREIILALGRLGDARAGEPLASLLESRSDFVAAADALKELGRPAEPPVIARVEKRDSHVQIHALMILAKIGTPASLPALGAIADDESHNFTIRRLAREAIEAIKKRSGPKR